MLPIPLPGGPAWEELIERLKAAIVGLPQRQQHVLSMRLEHGMSLREIAAVLNVTEESADQFLLEAIGALRPLIGGMNGAPHELP